MKLKHVDLTVLEMISKDHKVFPYLRVFFTKRST